MKVKSETREEQAGASETETFATAGALGRAALDNQGVQVLRDLLGPGDDPRTQGQIGYIGLNAGAPKEAAVLEQNNAERGGVGVAATLAKTMVNDSLHSPVAPNPYFRNIMKSYGLSDEATKRLADEVWVRNMNNFRQQQAEVGFAILFGEAHAGLRSFERVVLSGHSIGSGAIFGGGVWLSLEYLIHLGRDYFPKACPQVKHVMLSACNSGHARGIELVRKLFPDVQTIWAYMGPSPATKADSGDEAAKTDARSHIAAWEDATDGEKVGRSSLARGTSGASNIVTWVNDGTEQGKTSISAEKKLEMKHAKATLDRVGPAGRRAINALGPTGVIGHHDAAYGTVYAYYTVLQVLIHNAGYDFGIELPFAKLTAEFDRVSGALGYRALAGH